MKLIGTVNGVSVEMSYDSLRRIAKFDSKPANQYIFPRLEDFYFNPQKPHSGNTCLIIYSYREPLMGNF
ncbi:hypothetical protein Hanom_Chr05g00419751 [Helianthus anomalus]